MKKVEKEFELITTFIKEQRKETVGFLNYAAVSTYWQVGAYILHQFKAAAWGGEYDCYS